jgi:hypothetical protein
MKDIITAERLGWVDVVIFSSLIGALVSLVRGYSFGTGDHIELLPQIFRLLDPSYCANDFFVNASQDFSPRIYFSQVIAFLSHFLSLPFLFLILTWLTNTILAIVTYYAARDILKASDFSAMLACALVLSWSGIEPGDKGNLAALILTSSSIAYPFALLSIWMGIKGRAVPASIAAVAALIFHPLIGFEAGFISLLTVSASLVIFGGANKRKLTIETVTGWLILLAAAYFLWFRHYSSSIDAEQFIAILAYFRHPHHYVPSTWPLTRLVGAVCQLFAIGVALRWWKDSARNLNKTYFRIFLLIIIILLLWLGGYVFVELIPCRILTTAQVFRLAFIINWIAFMLFAEIVTSFFRRKEIIRKIPPVIVLLGSGTAQPVLAAFGHVAGIIVNRMGKGLAKWSVYIIFAVISAAGIIVLTRYGNPRQSAVLIISIIFSAGFITHRAFMSRIAAFVLASALFIVVSLSMNVSFDIGKSMDSDDGIAEYALKHTPEDAVFITPPQFGRFRLTARRAIVVDFKACPFGDAALVEWKNRLDDCYGETSQNGSAAVKEMEKNYATITESQLQTLAKKYSASYVVLFRETDVPSFEPVYENDGYKIIKLTGR